MKYSLPGTHFQWNETQPSINGTGIQKIMAIALNKK